VALAEGGAGGIMGVDKVGLRILIHNRLELGGGDVLPLGVLMDEGVDLLPGDGFLFGHYLND